MKRLLLVISIAAILVAGVSCGKKKASNVIKIGIMKPNTYGGEMIEKGAKMALEEVNAKGGILGKKLVPVLINDDNKPDVGKMQLRQAIESENIDFIVGGFNSSVVSSAMDVMSQYKKIWLGTGGASPAIIKKIAGNYAKYKYYFRVGTIDALLQGQAGADFVISYLGPKYNLKKIALVGSDNSYSKFILGQSKKKLVAKGFTIAYEKYLPSSTKDFSPVFSKIKETGAKIVIQAWPGTEAIVFIKQFYAQKVPAILIGAVVESLKDEYFQETSGACVYQADFSPQSGPAPMTTKTKAFAAAFKKKYNKSAGYIAYPAYDTINILKAAIEKVGSLDTEKIVTALEGMEYEGNIWYKFTKNHDLTMGIKDDKVYAILPWFQWQTDGSRKAVYPEKFKEAEYTLAPWVKEDFKKAGIIK